MSLTQRIPELGPACPTSQNATTAQLMNRTRSAGKPLGAGADRVHCVKAAITKGAPEMAWSTYFETDYGLRWDDLRKVWTTTEGDAVVGDRLLEYARRETT
jgi:hypothetical protein